MAGPLAGLQVAQLAQQKLPDQAAQQAQAKAGPSKFDQALNAKADVAGKVQQAGQVQATQATQKTQLARAVEQAGRTEKARLQKLDTKVTAKAADPVNKAGATDKTTSMVMGMMSNMERGQVAIDKLVSGAFNGKNFNNTELLQLQAGMYKYTQELELTGKVVEKATSGLKDTLKTQV